jgi:hypothetical protein
MRRLFALAALAWSTAAMSAAPASRAGAFHLDAPPARVFPMFTAEGERAWAPGWDPEMLSGGSERGSVFRTRSHGRDVIWIVTAYEPEAGRVSYARLVDGSNMGLVDVACAAEGDGTRVTVRYTLTAVSTTGAAQVAHLLDAPQYDDFMREWRDAIGAALGKLQTSLRGRQPVFVSAFCAATNALMCSSSTGSGTEPISSSASWNLRMSNLPPSSCSAIARSSTILISPSLYDSACPGQEM